MSRSNPDSPTELLPVTGITGKDFGRGVGAALFLVLLAGSRAPRSRRRRPSDEPRERVLEGARLDHALHEDQRVQFRHGSDRLVHLMDLVK